MTKYVVGGLILIFQSQSAIVARAAVVEQEQKADVSKTVLSLQQNKHIPPELRGVPDHQLVQALGGCTHLATSNIIF